MSAPSHRLQSAKIRRFSHKQNISSIWKIQKPRPKTIMQTQMFGFNFAAYGSHRCVHYILTLHPIGSPYLPSAKWPSPRG
jgi:hypothetical protein